MNATDDAILPLELSSNGSLVTRRFAGTIAFLALWLCLWLSHNAPLPTPALRFLPNAPPGAWRAALALLVALAGAGLALRRLRTKLDPPRRSPLTLWIWCGLIGIISGILLGPSPQHAIYWGIAYLSPLLLARDFRQIAWKESTPRHLLRLQWIIMVAAAFLYLIISIKLLGILDQIRAGTLVRLGGTYHLDVHPYLMINANGAARYSAITIILCLSQLLTGAPRRHWPIYILTILAMTITLLYAQSRGTYAALVLAGPVLLYLTLGLRRTFIIIGSGLAVLVLAELAGAPIVWYFTNGEPFWYIAQVSSRGPVWVGAQQAFLTSPIIGLGFYADRIIVGDQVHNAWFQVLVQSGIVGLVLFIAGWWRGLALLRRLGFGNRFVHVPASERLTLIQVSTVFFFFLGRTVTESTGAVFGVDLLMMTTLLLYLYAAANPSTQSSLATNDEVVIEKEANAGPMAAGMTLRVDPHDAAAPVQPPRPIVLPHSLANLPMILRHLSGRLAAYFQAERMAQNIVFKAYRYQDRGNSKTGQSPAALLPFPFGRAR